MKPEGILIVSNWGFGEPSLLIICLFSIFNRNILLLRQMRFTSWFYGHTVQRSIFGGHIFILMNPKLIVVQKLFSKVIWQKAIVLLNWRNMILAKPLNFCNVPFFLERRLGISEEGVWFRFKATPITNLRFMFIRPSR